MPCARAYARCFAQITKQLPSDAAALQLTHGHVGAGANEPVPNSAEVVKAVHTGVTEGYLTCAAAYRALHPLSAHARYDFLHRAHAYVL